MRVFVALEVPEETKRKLRELVAALGGACRGARWVHTEGMHVTLKFVGETSPERVEQIKVELGRIRARAAVEMSFRTVGFFPNDRHPRVFWAGIEASPNLGELAAAIERAFEALGIPPETRPFKPHLTLARFKSEDGLTQLRKRLAELAPFEFGATHATELHLYQSTLKSSGAVYTCLASYSFVEAA